MENNHSNIDFYNKGLLILIIGILLGAVLIIPLFTAEYYTDLIRGMTISGLLILFASFQLYYNRTKTTFSKTDVAWLALILLTGISALWATNTFYVYFGTITTIVLYLCYKAFEVLDWNKKNSDSIANILSICFLLGFGTIAYYLILEPRALYNSKEVANVLGVNLNFLGSFVVVLFPFVLFRRGRIVDFVNPILFLLSFYVLYQIGSAQVVLALIILGIIYLIFRLNISTKILTYLVIGSLVIGSLSVAYIYNQRDTLGGKSFVIDEFKYQNDRFQMWGNSLLLFSKSPLVGIGKNNWPVEVYQYGYNNYARRIKKPYGPTYYKHAHNSFFQTLSELGILGLLAYGGIIFFPITYIIKKNIKLSDFEYACMSSLILFFFLSLMYGIVYNHFINFKGIPILVVLVLAFLGRSNAPILSIKNRYFYSLYLLIALGGFFFFYQCHVAKSNYVEANKLSRQKKYKQAEDLYLKSLVVWDKGQVYEGLGKLYKRQKKNKKAIKAYQDAQKRNPYKPQISHNLADVLFRKKKYEEALHWSQKTHELFKGYIPNQLLLANCYLKTGDTENASLIAKLLKEDLELRIGKIDLLKKNKRKEKTLSPKAAKSEKQLRDSFNSVNEIIEKLSK